MLFLQASVLVDSKQTGAASGDSMTAEGLWARYATRLTSIVVRHLRADYWHMPPVSCPYLPLRPLPVFAKHGDHLGFVLLPADMMAHKQGLNMKSPVSSIEIEMDPCA